MLQSNNAAQNLGLIAWDGTNKFVRDISQHLEFTFVFEVTATLGAAAIFDIVQYAPDASNPCVHNAGSEAVTQVKAFCSSGNAANARITIPSGTVAGTIVTVTLACRPAKFVAPKHISGGSTVKSVLVLSRPVR